jgi:hypothetical protein
MSLSTFSSESEWKVWVVVLAILIATEVTMRGALAHLSQDLVHVRQIPEKVERLSTGEGTRVLALGNSITREGIDITQLEADLDSVMPVSIEEIHPDDTAITEWLYGYIHFLEVPRKDLDLLLICFAEDQLQDRPKIDVRRLAYNYSDWSTTITTFRDESFTLDQQAEFILARLWASFANAERVQKRIMDYVIPYYRSTAKRINSSLAKPRVGSQAPPLIPPTYRRLQKLIRVLQAHEVGLMVFAFPVGKSYEMDRDLEQLLRKNDVSLIDVRKVAGITPANFPDGYHMDEAAAQLMTRAVSNQVADWLKQHD